MKNNKFFVVVTFVFVIAAFVLFKSLYKSAEVVIAPAMQSSELIKEYNPRIGPDDAKVKIVEFLDPECEACSKMAPIVKQLMSEYEGKVQLIVRYMPYHGNS